MALKVGDTAYVVYKALTKGIHKVTVRSIDSTGWMTLHGVWWGGREGKEVFATVEGAQEKAQAMARRALVALEEKRARLEQIARDGTRVIEPAAE